MHILSFVRLVVVAFLLAAFGGGAAAQTAGQQAADYGVAAEMQTELAEAAPSVWLNRLNAIELELEQADVSLEAQGQALADLETIGEAAAARLKQIEARLAPLRSELATLGSAPAEGDPPEPDEIADLRSQVTARIAEVEVRQREVLLAVVRAENLETALIGRKADPRRGRIWRRAPSLWSAGTWRVAGDGLATLYDAVVEAPGVWWRTIREAEAPPTGLFTAIIAGVVALLLGVPLRRWLLRRLGRHEDELEPSYARRIAAAFVTAIAEVLLPVFALAAIGMAIQLVATSGTLLPQLAISLCLAGIGYFLMTGLARAALAPKVPAWRILPVTEEGAVLLNRRIRAVAVFLVAVVIFFRTADTLGLLQAPEFGAVTTLFLDAALAAMLLTLLPSRFWEIDEDTPASSVVIGVSVTLGLLLVAVPLLDLIGFSALASYLLVVLVVTVVAAGLALLLRAAGHEALVQILRPASALRLRLYRWVRLGEGGAAALRFLAGLLLDIVLFLALAYGLLRFYGVPDAQVERWLSDLADGIPIGNVVISPLDIVLAVLVFVAAVFITGLMRRWLGERLRTGTRLDLGVRNAIVSGVGYTGVVLAIVLAIATVGLDLSNLALVASALSVGIGFGLRTVVENFVAGLMLLVGRPIKEGDWIIAAGHQGTVKRISVRSTEIETFDRASVIVPNSELIAQPVQNWTHTSRMARIIVPIGVAYGSDTAKVRDILLASADAHPDVLKFPEPRVIFQQFGASSLDFELRCFVKDTDYFLSAKSDLNFAIDAAFREQGIEIPFPQRDLHVRAGEPLQVILGEAPSKPSGVPPQEAKPPAPPEAQGGKPHGPEVDST